MKLVLGGDILMNLKQMVQEMIESHPDWDMLTKVRWIYLKTCELFSYDWRFFYSDNRKKEEIYHFRLDKENISQFEIICSTWAYLFCDLLQYIGVTAEVINPKPPHCLVRFELEKDVFLADATKGYDFSRVKIGFSTNGFKVASGGNVHSFKKELSKRDELIGFKKNLYVDKAILKIAKELQDEGYNRNNSLNDFSFAQLDYKMDLLKLLINDTGKMKRFDDTDYYFSYLGRKLLKPLEIGTVIVYPYYNLELDSIVDLITYGVYDENRKFYIICNCDGKYRLESIPFENVEYFLENYKGNHKNLFRG